MDAKLQRRIQRYGWDKAVGAYEDGWRDSLAPAHQELLRLARARPGEKVLEVACGTGLVTLPLAEAVGPSGSVLATDISEKMVEQTGRAAKAEGFDNVHARHAGAEDLTGVPDAVMDLAVCALGLMYVPEPDKALAEMRRALKPGGRAVLAVWGARARCGWAEIFPIVEARVKSDVCPLFFRLGTGATLENELAAVGFTGVETTRVTAGLHYENDAAALEAAFVGGPVALAYQRFDEATRQEAHRAYLQSIARFRGPEGYRIPGEFVVCRAWGR